jgi:hypothetical protein
MSPRDILFDPANPEIVYLSDLLSGVYRSTDVGNTWTYISNELSNHSTTGLGISSDGNHLYVATSGEGVFRLDINGEPPVSMVTSVGRGDETAKPEEGAEELEPEKSPGALDEVSGNTAVVVMVVIVAVGVSAAVGVFLVWRKSRI